MSNPRRLTEQIKSGGWKLRKRTWQFLRRPSPGTRRPVFVSGCQRSGTTLLASVLRRSLHTRVYHESEESEAFLRCRLRPEETILQLIVESPAELVVFKSICDSQWTDRFLDRYPDAKAIWIYRKYEDVANSAVAEWGEHQRDVISALQSGKEDDLAWRGERISEHVRAVLSQFRGAELSAHDGAALFWWMRNQLFFELALETDPRVHLLRYESLTKESESTAVDLCRFLGIPYSARLVSEVHTRSVGKRKSPELSAGVSDLCEEMLERLDRLWERRAVASVAG